MISQMLLLISLANSFGVQAGASVWFRVGTHAQCDVSQGEKYLAGSSGSVADEAACKQSCDDEDDCRTVTYFGGSKWCRRYSTACTKRKYVFDAYSYAPKSGTTTAGPPPKNGVTIKIAWQHQMYIVHNSLNVISSSLVSPVFQ